MLKLAIHDFEGRTHFVPLKDGEYSIGRDDANQICLSDRNVSRQHARVLAKNSQVWIENVAATYGTRFNNLLLRDRTEIQPGDIIEVGDYKLELVSEGGVSAPKRDNALKDGSGKDGGAAGSGEPRPPSGQSGKGKPPDGATAIVNLADISSLLNKDSSPSQSITEAAQPRLTVESENLRGLELRITKTPVVIGRVRENADLVIDHRSISKEHARLTRLTDGTWQVLDLGSANGIKVNGEPYSKSEIRSGDRLELGHVTMRFLAAGAKTASGSVAPAAGGKKNTGTLVLAGGIALLVVVVVIISVLVFGNKSGESPKTGDGTKVGDSTAKAAKTGDDKAKADEVADPEAKGPDEKGADEKDRADKAAAGKAVEDKPGAEKAAGEGPAAKADPDADKPAKAEVGAPKGDVAEQLMAAVQAKQDEGKYEEAAVMLEAAKISNPGSAQIAAKHAEMQKFSAIKKKLMQAEKVLNSDPTKALEIASDVYANSPQGTPLRMAASSIVDAAKEKIRKPSKPAVPKEVKETVKEVKPPREETPTPTATSKSPKDLYDEARESLGSSEWDKAISLGKQALKAGYKKANTVVAKAYWGKGEKGNCLKYAQAAIDAGFDDSSMQGLLNKCQ